MIIVIWGVSGCGKSTIAQLLAASLDCEFFDADDYHPEENREKMRAGIPLTDEDRWPWLEKLADILITQQQQEKSAILACSALRQIYRDKLSSGQENVAFVHLSGSFELISKRLSRREHEFMNSSLLHSQFDTLEPTSEGITISIDQTAESTCEEIRQKLALL